VEIFSLEAVRHPTEVALGAAMHLIRAADCIRGRAAVVLAVCCGKAASRATIAILLTPRAYHILHGVDRNARRQFMTYLAIKFS